LRFVKVHAFDRETNRQTEFSSLDCVCIPFSAVMISHSIVTLNFITITISQACIYLSDDG